MAMDLRQLGRRYGAILHHYCGANNATHDMLWAFTRRPQLFITLNPRLGQASSLKGPRP